MNARLTSMPRWAVILLSIQALSIAFMGGVVTALVVAPVPVPATAAYTPQDRTHTQGPGPTFTPPERLRSLDDAVREDLNLSIVQWLAQSGQTIALLDEALARGERPIAVADDRVVVEDSPLEPAIALQMRALLQPLDRAPLPPTPAAGPWSCSPGVLLEVEELATQRRVPMTVTAAHCLTALASGPSTGPIPPVLPERISDHDALFMSDTVGDPGVSAEGADVALTTRLGAIPGPADGPTYVPVAGIAPMLPGMSVCAHGLSTGWRCGKVLDEHKVSPEGVSMRGIGMASMSGDSGGRVILGDRVVGVVSSYVYLHETTPGQDIPESQRQILSTWAGSVFDTADKALEQGYALRSIR